MRRGTRVGQAYVAITADGTGINEEIVDAVDEAGPDVRKAGKEHGEDYGDEFGEGLRVRFSHAGEKAGAELNRRIADQGDEGGKDYGDNLEKTLKRAAKRIGKNVGSSIGEALSDNLFDTFNQMIDAMEKRLDKVSGNGGKGGGGSKPPTSGGREFPPRDPDDRLWAQAARMHEEWARRNGLRMESAIKMDEARERRLGLMVERAIKMDNDRDRKLGLQHERALQMNEERDQRLGRMQEAALRMNAARDERIGKLDEDRIQRLGRMQEAALRINAQFNEGKADGSGRTVRSSGGSDKGGGIDDIIGRMLGKGSRNNALNLFGKSVGGIVGLLDKGAKFATGFADGMSKAATGASLMQKLMAGFSGGGAASGLAKGLSSFAASAPVAIAAAALITLAMSALASVLGAVVGLLVAMTSTIVSALAGAAIVGVGAFAALGAAAGLATLAFTSMTDKQRAAAQKTFEPIHEMAAGLGQIMMREIIPAFETWSKNLQNALVLIKPLAEVMGGAFARAGTILTQSLSGPGIQLFIDALGTTLPRIVTNLSKAFGDFLNGVGGVFAAILPSVQRFSGYLKRVADDFAKWATSAKGQNSIKDFVDRALTALDSLWGAVKEIGGFISDILFNPESQKAGNTIFDAIKEAFQRFRRAIKNGDLERWFSDAIDFAKDLKYIIGKLKDTFMALYNSGVLESVGDGIKAIGDALEIVNQFLEPMINYWGVVLPNVMKVALGPVNALADAVGWLADRIKEAIDLLGTLNNMPSPSSIFNRIKDAATGGGGGGGNEVPGADGTETTVPGSGWSGRMAAKAGKDFGDEFGRGFDDGFRKRTKGTIDDLIKSGHDTLAATSEDHGGHKPEPKDSGSGANDGSNVGKSGAKDTKKGSGTKHELGPLGEWVNPYIEMANKIMAQGAKVADEIRHAANDARSALADAMADATLELTTLLVETGKTLVAGVRDAARTTDAKAVGDAFLPMIENLGSSGAAAVAAATASAAAGIEAAKAARVQMISTAEAAVQQAASNLAGASNEKEAKAAVKALTQAKHDLAYAKATGEELVMEAQMAADKLIAESTATKERMDAAASILQGQSVLSQSNVANLLKGISDTTTTLADYAEARKIVAERLVEANERLVAAVALRDDYANSVSESAKAFGSLMTAQAKTLNGVAQALTATDITDNLRDRLTKIKKFQDNLRILLAQGLSNDAYKQLVDAGVDGGSAFAQALVDGGQGSISEVNGLTDEIGKVSDGLGSAAATRLYQAGVDAAQGLVDGLMSLSTELDTAATALGEAIANAVKKELGIASPSKVMHGLMFNDVGDGMANGLDDAGAKVGAAAARLSSRVAVSPEVAAYAAKQNTSPTMDETVSGNAGNSGDPRFRDLIVNTPTEDPQAVAMEVLNEVTGRLP